MKKIIASAAASVLTLCMLTLVSVAHAGVYTPAEGLAARGDSAVCTSTAGLWRWGYHSARLSYPCGLKEKAPAITLTGGYTNIKEQMYWLSDHLTSHGYVVLTITPYNVFGTPPVWESAHKAGIEELLQQNRTWYSPVRNRIDTDRLGMMGYSMGGGGALLAAGDLGNTVKAVVGLSPYLDREQPYYANISASTLLIGGSFDFTALPNAVASYYETLPADTSRALAIIRYLNHLDWVGFPSSMKNRGKILSTAWLNRHLKDDSRFDDWFDGDKHDQHLAEDWFSRYAYSR
ncbi:MAG: dienelactone hydrolase family protein [Alcanivoracaceae bacterium]|jgi:dienelactone hydrolase|nr:dienelactone hydrolase family protein [Alcanivoracaceae bacterium]